MGLGNIWRFPYIAGENGGAAFILVYVVLSFLIAVPIMLSEFAIGRRAQRGVLGAYNRLAPRSAWQGAGYLGVLSSLVILSFYAVIAGWALKFLQLSLFNGFSAHSSEQISGMFHAFVATGWQPLAWTLLFIAVTALIVLLGVEKGIERINKVLMPMIVLILIGLALNGFTLEGAREGISFLLRPDFSKIDGHVLLQAMGQSFFSLSLGMGTMITYGSYIPRQADMFTLAGTVAISDVIVAVLSGLAIFPAVFSFGISPTSGPELVFITLPNLFVRMTGGYFLSVVFFFLLFMAAVTSSVSLMEVMAVYISEELRLRRRTATAIAALVVSGTASLCLFSQMPDSQLRVLGGNIFDLFNDMSSNVMLPLGGLLTVLFAGWFVPDAVFRNEITSGGRYGPRLYPQLRFIVRYIAPVVIVMLFFSLF